MATLPSYWQEEQRKRSKGGQATSPYSAPVEPAGGGSAGGPSAPSAPSAPKGSAGGGTGFVSFGQYFGANAPAIQQQAQQAVAKAKNASQPLVNAPAGATGFDSFRSASFGPAQDPLSAKYAQAQRQSAALQPLANYGDMGKDVSAFDQLLGGGVTKRAAKQEQQRLGNLRGYLEAEKAQLAQEEASRQQQEQAKYEADRQREEAEWYARQEEERKYYEALKAQEAARQQYEAEGGGSGQGGTDFDEEEGD